VKFSGLAIGARRVYADGDACQSSDAKPAGARERDSDIPTTLSPDFTMAAMRPRKPVTQGIGTGYTVTIMREWIFRHRDSRCQRAASNARLVHAGIDHRCGSATLNVTTAAGTPAGSSTSRFTGTSGSLSHTTTVSLLVNGPAPSPDFTIAAAPASRTIARRTGEVLDHDRRVEWILRSGELERERAAGERDIVAYACIDHPAGTATFDVTTTASTPTGTSTLTITGTSGSLTHTTAVTLIVSPNVHDRGSITSGGEWRVGPSGFLAAPRRRRRPPTRRALQLSGLFNGSYAVMAQQAGFHIHTASRNPSSTVRDVTAVDSRPRRLRQVSITSPANGANHLDVVFPCGDRVGGIVGCSSAWTAKPLVPKTRRHRTRCR